MTTDKRVNEYFVVAKGNQALKKTGKLQTTGQSVNIADGQLGIICAANGLHIDYGEFLGTTNNPAGSAPNTANDVPVIKIVQGTPANSNNSKAHGWPAQDEGFKSTPYLRASSLLAVATALPDVPTFNSVVLTPTSTVQPSAEYKLYLTLRSTRTLRDYGRNENQFTANVVTPSVLPTSPVDYLLQHLASRVNINSRLFGSRFAGNKNVVALCFNISGAGSGTTIGSLTVGSVVTIQTSGSPIQITLDEAWVQTLNKLIANTSLTATSKLVAINTSTAGNASDADMLVVVGLDEEESFVYSGIPFTKTQVKLAVAGQFTEDPTLPTVSTGSVAVEDANSGKFLKYVFEKNAFGQSGLTQLAGYSDYLVLAPSYIEEDKRYTVTTLDFENTQEVFGGLGHKFPLRVFILLPAQFTGTDVSTGFTASTTATNTVTDLNAILQPWLASIPNVRYNGQATVTAPFA